MQKKRSVAAPMNSPWPVVTMAIRTKIGCVLKRRSGASNPPSALERYPVVNQVLLIDDNPTQLRVREAVLRGAGLAVSIATTAESALALLRTGAHEFGVIITDHVLPGASGADFVRELRAANPDIPVIVVSGMPDIEEEYEGMNVAFRQKPLPPAELIELVRSRLKLDGSSKAS